LAQERRTYRREDLKTGKVGGKTTCGITNLPPDVAGPQQLEVFWRGHWTIENRDHYVRDETMGEDRSQLRTGNAPQAMATLRNAVLGLFRRRGWQNIASAMRYYRASLLETWQFIGST